MARITGKSPSTLIAVDLFAARAVVSVCESESSQAEVAAEVLPSASRWMPRAQ